ncbi:DUF2834 domain-containing protein [Gemmatimonas phototrophica]|uniref:DUF2834 domain-containing protein n=1 Tax=Gemmatimonas phototrophica TaxID=1379270 RepID=A0A143BL82_9BACT|nr:DUF2834 domain-containing protein [Gemmatimonas phototrophica]AMW05280.1 hypothetical protein GEMMAAP_11670 [Gemmatimonas phototrophica]
MRRPLLIAFAILFLAYEQWSFYMWLQQHGTVSAGLSHAWMTLRLDPMVFMAWNDMGIFTALVLIWLWRDLRQTGRSFLWWPATLLLGCPPLLIYLSADRTQASTHP